MQYPLTSSKDHGVISSLISADCKVLVEDLQHRNFRNLTLVTKIYLARSAIACLGQKVLFNNAKKLPRRDRP